MDIAHAISEPLVKLIAFHNAFNRNVKLTYGALAQVNSAAAPAQRPLVLPNGGEPWGRTMPWRDLAEATRGAAIFISEMGIARAASAFEDYLIGATAELDRADGRIGQARPKARAQPCGKANVEAGDTEVASLRRLVSRLNIDPAAIAADVAMVEFFVVARNCVVHRSNRASPRLVELRTSAELSSALKTWPRRQGKWTLSVPELFEGQVVNWSPRHAIMASAAYHRCATLLDAGVVSALKHDCIVGMAAHWCLLTDNPVPCPAKLDAQTMVRTQLTGRYLVPDATLTEVVQALRNCGIWDDVQRVFEARGLFKASHAKRRAIKEREQ